MKNGKRALVLAGVLFALSGGAIGAGVDGMLKDALKGAGATGAPSAGSAAISGLSNSEMVDGLKEALGNGVETAIKTLGKTDGFLGNELVRIAMPDSLKMVESGARKMGQGKYADEFITSMNRAAEQATPAAAEVLGGAIRAMSVEDAAKILKGPNDAATQYFRKTSGPALTERFLPIVKKSTDQAGVTSAYKGLVGNAGGMLGGLGGLGGNKNALDVDRYVTEKALDGLFTYIAAEEKRIRENPLARSSDLLKKVFGR